jgi:hypothetical protein
MHTRSIVESVPSGSAKLSIIDYDYTIVNIDLSERQKNYVEPTIIVVTPQNLFEEELRKQSSAGISLYLNNSDNSNNFSKLKRHISQKSRKGCFQAILNIPKSLEMEQVLLNMKYLKSNLVIKVTAF